VRALATWCFRHRVTVVIGWLVLLVGTSIASATVGSAYSNGFSLPDTPSARAVHLLQASSPGVSGDTERIVWESSGGARVDDPAVRARIATMLGRVGQLEHVTRVVSPYESEGAAQVNPTATVAFASVTFDVEAHELAAGAARALVDTARSASTTGLQVSVAGRLAQLSNRHPLGGTGLGVLLAAVVLLLVFGSFFAMALPLLATLASLGTAIALVGLISNVMRMPEFSPELVLLIGLGVGVDYALFIVTRHRQGLIAGRSTQEAAVTAINTSGRAVLFAGIIVCIALLGMFALGVSFLYGMAVAASIGVLLTMLAALTLIPALLGFIDHRVLSRTQRRTLLEKGPRIVGSSGPWARWAAIVQARPLVPAVLATLLIALLAVPFFSLRSGEADEGNDAQGTTTRTAYDALAAGFGPGFNGALQIVSVLRTPADRSSLAAATAAIGRDPGIASVQPPVVLPGTRGEAVALLNAYPTSAPQDEMTARLIGRLRAHTIPEALGTSSLLVYVGGTTAIFTDFSHVLSAKLPLFVGVVVFMSFLLLVIVFRSVVVPLTAAVMNLASAAAAFGMVVAVFQWGWLGPVFGVNRSGPVEPFLPVMLFAILFGLSMDYEVFLVARIHEEWIRCGDNATAVRNGIATTGKTITAAALIMILVFGSFILSGERVIKEFGLGLAGGILVDAVIIRSAIIPSAMLLIGRRNWWFPPVLERFLPHLSVEPPEVADQVDVLA
jgi:RND superfamily putative drug exporter